MQNLVQIDLSNTDGEITTTSLEIARVFEREHADVLKSIKHMSCSREFYDGNFTGGEYLDKNGQSRPSYIITRDGFDFLAMGFTGEKAGKYKEAYITEFSRMERALRNLLPAAPTLAHLEPELRAGLSIALLIGLKDNQALISANRAVRRTTGVNVLELFGHTSLPSEAPSRDYTATELGIMIADRYGDTDPHVGLSGQVVNHLMREAGLHYKPGPSGWELTDLGKKYGHLVDIELEDKKTSKQGIKWFLSTLDLLLKFIEDEIMTGEIEEEVTKAAKRVATKRRREAMAEMRLVHNSTEEE